MAQAPATRMSLMTLASVVADIFSGIYNAMVQVSEANAKVLRIKALYALSDDELAARDLQREDIVRLVMADVR